MWICNCPAGSERLWRQRCSSHLAILEFNFNPIMLGINVHLVIITPLIMAAFYAGAREISDTLVAHSYRGVLVTVFVVGCALTVFSQRGFIGTDGLPKGSRWMYIRDYCSRYRQRPPFGLLPTREATFLQLRSRWLGCLASGAI